MIRSFLALIIMLMIVLLTLLQDKEEVDPLMAYDDESIDSFEE